MCIAAQNGHFNVITLLLAEGADINTTSSNGVTPLVIAAYTGHYEIVKLWSEAQILKKLLKNDIHHCMLLRMLGMLALLHYW